MMSQEQIDVMMSMMKYHQAQMLRLAMVDKTDSYEYRAHLREYDNHSLVLEALYDVH